MTVWTFQKSGTLRYLYGKVPVLFFFEKNVDGLTFADAKYRLTELVAAEAGAFILSDGKSFENEKSRYQAPDCA